MIINIPGINKSIGGRDIFIIADIGKNFIQTAKERSVKEYLINAKALVDAAIVAGADAVKFQTHEVEDEQLPLDITSPHFLAMDRYKWVMRNTNATPLKEFWEPLKAYCDKKGIIFLSTPMSRKAAQKLDKLGVPFWKIGSGDIQDYILLNFVAETKKPVIISTGMVSLCELDEVIVYLKSRKVSTIVLYCVSEYPAPLEYFNLSNIEYLKEKYPHVVVGFSDHSIGYDISFAAIKLGAKVIEKHFSFSREFWGPDHKVSMTPEEFFQMTRSIRDGTCKNIDTSLFYGEKNRELDGKDNKYRPYFNKSLVAGQNIPAGTVIQEDMIFAMRPHGIIKGLPANRLKDIIGKKVKVDIAKYNPLTSMIIDL